MRTLTSVPVRGARVLRAVATVVLLLGYADLARGGITAAPLLMVLGYGVLIPAVILTWR